MATATLGEFVLAHRQALQLACRRDPDETADSGILVFLDDIVRELSNAPPTHAEMATKAAAHGGALFRAGFTVGEVVHNYGCVCQAITGLAVQMNVTIDPADFRILNRCLDDAIASAVSEYVRRRHDLSDAHAFDRSMTVKNLAMTALQGFEAVQSGTLGIHGTTGGLVHRSLLALCDLK